MTVSGRLPAAGWRRRGGFWLFAAHLLSLFSLAASNFLLGACVLASPFTGSPLASLSPRARRWLWWLALYVLLIGVSVALSYEPRVSAGFLWGGVFNMATPVLALLLVRGERDVRTLVRGLIVLATVLACAGLVQYVLGQDNLDHRIRASLSHYMTFAGLLLACDCLLLAWLVCGKGWRRPWAWGALILIQLALLGSYTRNAWVALLVAVTALILARAPRLLIAYLPAALLLSLLLPVPILHRFASIGDLQDPSNYDRLCMAAASLDMIADRPVFGLGPKMVAQRYTIYRRPTAPRYWVPHLHNSYLSLVAERGLASLAVFLVLLGLSARQAWLRLRQEGGITGPRADLYVGALLAMLAFAVAGLFEDNWADTEVQRVLLFVLALPFCLDSGAADRTGPAAQQADGAVV